VAEEIAGRNPSAIDESGIPRVTYSHPEVASVGLTEEAARRQHGQAVSTVTYDLAGNGKSQILKTAGADVAVAASLVHAPPTQGEALGEALLALAGKPLHVRG